MKTNFFLTVFLFAFVASSCGQVKSKSVGDKKPLDLSVIKFIEIRNHHGGTDTIQTIYKRLNSSQTKIFVDKFNSAKASGLYKYIVEYWVDVHLKDGTKRIFRANSSNIKEDNDYCFDLGDKNYLKTLWTTIK